MFGNIRLLVSRAYFFAYGISAARPSRQDFCASLDSPRTVAEQSPYSPRTVPYGKNHSPRLFVLQKGNAGSEIEMCRKL